jgi:alpha-1,3-mannosyltransferase
MMMKMLFTTDFFTFTKIRERLRAKINVKKKKKTVETTIEIIINILILLELVLNFGIIKYVKYTEIDWRSYGEEVDGFFKNKEFDYVNLRGQTGPLVYPAGFVYFFGFVRFVCGEEIIKAQCLFALMYVFNQWISFRILQKSGRVPIYFYPIVCLSKRMHSIYSLRMFNDGVCAIFCHLAVLAFMDRKNWNAKSINRDAFARGFAWLSIATSIKMNALLYLPPALVLLVGYGETLFEIFTCLGVFLAVQIILALPFLLTFPRSYLSRAFELTRVFTYKWTVNFKFLSEEQFVSKELANGLLIVHLTLLFVAAHRKWFRGSSSEKEVARLRVEQRFFWDFFRNFLRKFERNGSTLPTTTSTTTTTTQRRRYDNRKMKDNIGGDDDGNSKIEEQAKLDIIYPSENKIALILAQGNFIGILCARSLHYQFYAWYFNLLPLILFNRREPFARTRKLSMGKKQNQNVNLIFECLINGSVMLILEYCWNKYPSTSFSSSLLQATHVFIYALCVF